MKKTIMMTMIFLICGGINHATNVRIEARAKYFYPTEKAFKDIYGSGMSYGSEISIGIWRNFELGLTGSAFSKKGELTFTREETSLRIIAAGIVIKYVHPAAASVDAYGSISINYYTYKEKNPIGDVSTGKMGYIGRIGTYVKVIDGLFLDLYLDYSYCRIKPEELSVNIGGFGTGAGIGYQF